MHPPTGFFERFAALIWRQCELALRTLELGSRFLTYEGSPTRCRFMRFAASIWRRGRYFFPWDWEVEVKVYDPKL